MFWMAFFVSLALTVVGELLRPKQKPANAQASGLDEFDLPTAEEGRTIPAFFGKVKITGPNVTAYGDLESRALTRKVKTGMFSSTRQTYAHQYYLGVQFSLAHGSDDTEIHEILFGDTPAKHTRTNEGNGVVRFDFNDKSLFGGDEKEGGIAGTLRFYSGHDVQPANEYFGTLIGETPPAYRGLCHAVAEKMYFGTSHYIKPVSFIVSRYPNTLGIAGGRHRIGDDSNPAAVIYEVMTNAVWGVGLSGSDIDQVAFRAVADTLHAEGYGVSLLYNGQSTAADMIEDILRHVDGVVFSDPESGLVTIRLARKDYDPAGLPVLTMDDFTIDGIDFSRASWGDTKNTVKGTYLDREADFTTAVVSQQDLANVMQRNGEVVAEEIDFSGFSHYDPCARAVARALKTLSYPLARISGRLSRKAWKMRPNDVFVLNYEDLGVVSVVFRVTRVRYGGIRDNTVSIEAVEDIFAISDVAYVQPPPSGWVNPLVPPAPLRLQFATDLPYSLEPFEGSIVGTFGSRSGALDEGYTILSDRGVPNAELVPRGDSTVFTPFAVLPGALSKDAPPVQATGPRIIDLQGEPDVGGQEFAVIFSSAGEEWVGYTDIVEGRLRGFTRGVFDTPPISHPPGAVVAFATSGYSVENPGMAYANEETVQLRLPAFNPRGRVPAADAPLLTVDTRRRGSRPYPPGRIRIDGGVPPAPVPPDPAPPLPPINPEFDEGMTGWEPRPTPARVTASSWRVVNDPATARSGDNYLLWEGDSVDYAHGGYINVEIVHEQPFAPPGGEWVDVRIWLRASRADTRHLASARVYFEYFDAKGNSLGKTGGWGVTSLGATLDTGWVEQRDRLPLPDGAAYMTYVVVVFGGPGSKVMIDSLSWNAVAPGSVQPAPTYPDRQGRFILSWADRNRHYPALLTQNDPAVPAEDGGSTVVRVFRESDNALLAEGEGNMSSAVIELAYTGLIRVEVRAKVDNLESLYPQVLTLNYDGSGVTQSVVTVDSADYVLDGGGA